ncbi:MAG: hypothetical protein M3040_03095 [Bacteroidota bacterium]|nr:hypothetical protein [Bacteroidota bacterium]
MQDDQLIRRVIIELQNLQLEVVISTNSYAALHQALAERLNFLITNNFPLLISILYRLDISEKKLTQYLSEYKQLGAGDVIAELIIERQLQKLQSRNLFSKNSSDIPDEERW